MLPEIITPMNFSLIRDAICQLIANVRDAQNELANAEYGADVVNELFDFTIFPKRFRYPDMSEMPCVYVYFNEMSFPEDEQDVYENAAIGTLQVEYYTCGKSETKTDQGGNEIIVTADETAENRLSYMTAQLYKTLCSEETNVYRGTNNYIKTWRLKNWKRIHEPEADNTVGTVLGAVFEFEVGFDEPTYYAQTTEIKEFYTSLGIQNEYVDPFCKVLFDRQNK